MTTHARILQLLVVALLVAFAGPALAADAPNPEAPTAPPAAESADAPETHPEDKPAEPALDSALEQSFDSQSGECLVFCIDGQLRIRTTYEECCGRGTFTCPDGSQTSGTAFYPDVGFPEICA